MAGFNPDAYLAKRAAGRTPDAIQDISPMQSLPMQQTGGAEAGFDPDAYLAKIQPPQQEKSAMGGLMDRAQTQLESMGNTLAMGYLPHLQAGFEKVNNFIADPSGGVDDKLKAQGFKLPENDSYVDLRDQNLRRQAGQAERNPYDNAAGVVSGIATTLPISGATQVINRGTGLMSRLANSFAVGGGYSAVSNPGDTEGVVAPLQLAERSTNAWKGGGLGMAGQTGGEVISKTATAVKNAPITLDKFAKTSALKAAGAAKKDFLALMKSYGSKRGAKDAEEVGETLLSKGIVDAGDSLEDIAQKTIAAKQDAGQRIRGVYSKVKEFVTSNAQNLKPKEQRLLQMTNLEGKVASSKIRNRLGKFQQNKAGAAEVQAKIDGRLAEIDGLGDEIGDWLEYRNSIDDMINYAKDSKELPLYQQQLHGVRDELTKMIQNRVRAVGKIVKDPDMIAELRKANKEYGQLATVEKFAVNKLAGENANRFYSLGDRLSGISGTTLGAGYAIANGDSPEQIILKGFLGWGGAKAAAKYGRHSTAMAAKYAKNMGDMMKKGENMKKYGQPLIDAAKRSPEEFQAMLQQFSLDPKFQQLATQGQ